MNTGMIDDELNEKKELDRKRRARRDFLRKKGHARVCVAGNIRRDPKDEKEG